MPKRGRARLARGGAEGRRFCACGAGAGPASLDGLKSGARLAGALSPFTAASGSKAMPRRAPRRWRWNGCRGSLAPRRWTSSLAIEPRRLQAVLDAAAEYAAPPDDDDRGGDDRGGARFRDGVGVAGLQAIATARRLGAIVSATDVRSAVKERSKASAPSRSSSRRSPGSRARAPAAMRLRCRTK